MLIAVAAFEPGQGMAIANFFLAIFFVFTISLPLLLITRGDKTEANREFLVGTINPWSQLNKEIELTPVVVSGITQTNEIQPKLEIISENNFASRSVTEKVLSTEPNEPEALVDESEPVLATHDEVIAA